MIIIVAIVNKIAPIVGLVFVHRDVTAT
uniref:Uncharacterized protein n=1 Tax=Lepeophtheirus salmonis TaxID=72036 RepID=A0A0K2T058_LEPSM